MNKKPHIDDLCDLARLTVKPKPLPSMRRLFIEMVAWGIIGAVSFAALMFITLRGPYA